MDSGSHFHSPHGDGQAPSIAAASVWVIVSIPGSALGLLTSEITPVPPNICALKDAVKKKMKPALDYCPAAALKIWACAVLPKENPGGDSLEDSGAAPVGGHYYWVEVPALPSPSGCFSVLLRTHYISPAVQHSEGVAGIWDFGPPALALGTLHLCLRCP